jgi:hypothetical protein
MKSADLGTPLAVAVPRAARRGRYALGVLTSLLGLSIRDAIPGELADVGYGLEGKVVIPATDGDWDDPEPALDDDPIPFLHLQGAPRGGGPIPRDLLYATYACLTAPWERRDPSDEVGCPVGAVGYLARHGLLHEPLVHRYAALLGAALGLQPRRDPVLVVTHDVDDNFAHLFARRERLVRLRRELRAGRTTAAGRRAVGLVSRSLRRSRLDPNDRFGEWHRLHRAWGSRPTYFVASGSLFSQGSADQDVAYDIDHPSVREKLRGLAETGAEFGVHFSINAHRSAARLRDEREALERVVGNKVRAARHHWWALGRPPEPTWRNQATAGIVLDCSLGFNDVIGFRRGIAAPFRPFDPSTERALDVHVLPTLAMDGAVYGRPDAAGGSDELLRLMEAVDQVGGALVVDWHVHSANPAVLPGALHGLEELVTASKARNFRLLTPLELLEASNVTRV